MIEFIKNATKEFEQNGRSDKFIAMENRIIKSGKPMQIYFFARYAKGASVERLQPVIFKKGTLEQCFYFQKHVQGSKLRPFVKRAIHQQDEFWICKFMELAFSDYLEKFPMPEEEIDRKEVFKINAENAFKYAKIYDLFEDLSIFETYMKRKKANDVNKLIEKAKTEYELNGRSQAFIELEKFALHATGSANGNLFMQYLPNVDIRAFERVALLRGEPFNMCFIGTRVAGADRKLMLDALEMAKLDYRAIEKSLLDQQRRKDEIKKQIQNTTDKEKIWRLLEYYKHISCIPEYIVQIDNRYIPQVVYCLKHNYVKN